MINIITKETGLSIGLAIVVLLSALSIYKSDTRLDQKITSLDTKITLITLQLDIGIL